MINADGRRNSDSALYLLFDPETVSIMLFYSHRKKKDRIYHLFFPPFSYFRAGDEERGETRASDARWTVGNKTKIELAFSEVKHL